MTIEELERDLRTVEEHMAELEARYPGATIAHDNTIIQDAVAYAALTGRWQRLQAAIKERRAADTKPCDTEPSNDDGGDAA